MNENRDAPQPIRDARERMLDSISDAAEQELRDERYDWLRGQRRRRQLVVIALAMPVLYAGTMLLDWPFVTLALLLTYGAAWFLLRRATRTITDLPEEFLDERQRYVRYRAYYQAYLGAAAVISVLLVFVVLNQILTKTAGIPELTTDQLFDLIVAALFLVMVLPTSMFAWTEKDL